MSDTIEATYRTAGGREINVKYCDADEDGYDGMYYWVCPGDRVEIANDGDAWDRDRALATARDHAEACTAR